MKKVKSNKTFNAYQINNENDLDEFIATEVTEHDTIHKKDGRYRVISGGQKLFEVSFGNWLVVFSDNDVRNYTDEEFFEGFYLVDES